MDGNVTTSETAQQKTRLLRCAIKRVFSVFCGIYFSGETKIETVSLRVSGFVQTDAVFPAVCHQ